jgi:hypothetical protein
MIWANGLIRYNILAKPASFANRNANLFGARSALKEHSYNILLPINYRDSGTLLIRIPRARVANKFVIQNLQTCSETAAAQPSHIPNLLNASNEQNHEAEEVKMSHLTIPCIQSLVQKSCICTVKLQ